MQVADGRLQFCWRLDREDGGRAGEKRREGVVFSYGGGDEPFVGGGTVKGDDFGFSGLKKLAKELRHVGESDGVASGKAVRGSDLRESAHEAAEADGGLQLLWSEIEFHGDEFFVVRTVAGAEAQLIYADESATATGCGVVAAAFKAGAGIDFVIGRKCCSIVVVSH